MSKGLLVLSADKGYIERREEEKVRDAPRNFLDGAGKGVIGFGKAIGSGVAGVVTQPIKETKKGGVGGFFKGLGKGVVGLVVKPVSGTFDLISNTSEGVKNSAKDKDSYIEWCWFPRPFYNRENIFKVYNLNDAFVIGTLKRIDALNVNNPVFKASYIV